jgi:predicted ATPase/DNA-binding CsgD family transcriptional regulator
MAADQHPADGAWLVDAAPLPEPGLVAQTVADMLGVRAGRAQSWHHVLAERLRGRELLLLLDNCENHLAACADLARVLVRECPSVHVVATSREPLDIGEEVEWRVPPLSLPQGDGSDPRELLASEAVQLFVDRAAAALRGFALTAENAPDVARVCRDLDGLPLGLEVVAGHMASLGLKQLASRVHAHLALTLSGRRDAPARHQTLRATLDWSYALLSNDERVLLRRLAVFVDGWTLEAAQAVCSDSRLPPAPIADLLRRLQRKSLVFEVANNGPRYRLLEVTRQYTLNKLVDHEEWPQVGQRHLEWCAGLGRQVPSIALDLQHADRLEQERGNVRAALGWAVANLAADQGLRIAIANFPVWFVRGHSVEARSWLEQLLELPATPSTRTVRDVARASLAQLFILHAEYAKAETVLNEMLDEQRQRNDLAGIGRTSLIAGNAALWQGQLGRARILYAEALAQLGHAGSPEADIAVVQLARVAYVAGHAAAARDLLNGNLPSGQRRSRPIMLERAQQLEARLTADAGDAASALAQLGEIQDRQHRVGDLNGLVDSLLGHGQILLEIGRTSEAYANFQQAAEAAGSSGDEVRLTCAIEGVARALTTTDSEVAVRLAAAAASKRDRLGATAWPTDTALMNAALEHAQTGLGADAYQRAWQIGLSMLDADAYALAISPPLERPSVATSGVDTLTRREREVLRMLANGASAAQIGEQLVISRATVRKHVEHVMAKLDLHSRVQLARWAAQPDNLRLLA